MKHPAATDFPASKERMMGVMVALIFTVVGIGVGMSWWTIVAEHRYSWRD